MINFTLPEKPRVIESKNNMAIIEINGCYPGYGNTLGNTLRRVLLSSLPGAAITVVKIKGIKHEFSTVPGILEDVIQIILNLKQVRLKLHTNTDEPVMMSLKVHGEKEVKAKDIKVPSSVEIVNPGAHIATITDKHGELEMEIWAEKGLGYVPRESAKKENLEVGTIVLDAIFTPIKRINYTIQNTRVGERTDYDKLVFTIETDGTISPEKAFEYAAKKVTEYFKVLSEFEDIKEVVLEKKSDEKEEKRKDEKEVVDPLKVRVEDLKLPLKIINILVESKIKTVSRLVKKSEEDLTAIDGMGDKGVKEIRKAVGYLGLTLKS